MRNRLAVSAAVALLCVGFGHASAGVYTDDMSKCIVAAATPDDQSLFIRFVFSAMSAHPAVKPLSSMTPEQRNAILKSTGQLIQRLVTVDCRKETVTALKYEGNSALETAFGVLGQVAMRGLMSHPDVAGSLGALGSGMDDSKIRDLYKEAGIALKDSP